MEMAEDEPRHGVASLESDADGARPALWRVIVAGTPVR